MNVKLLLLLLQLAFVSVLMLGREPLRCKPPQIKFCNACRDVEVVSTFALKKCEPGYILDHGYCQTARRKCLPDELKLPSGGCRKKKRNLKRCEEISQELVKLLPICGPGKTPNDKCRKER